MKLCIAPCGKKKIWDEKPFAGPTKAKDVYIGLYAKTCIEYAEKFYPESYMILSAKHGFLYPDDVVQEPYNVSFNKPSTNPISVSKLVRQVEEKRLMRYDEIVVVAGSEYAEIAEQVFAGKKIITPLKDLGGMGPQISEMKRAISEGRSFDFL